MLGICYDTETTGLPDYKNPSEGPQQPHIVELAAKVVNLDTMAVVDFFSCLIKPAGWTWDENDEAYQAHGITFEQAMDEGIPEPDALAQFLAMHNSAVDLRIGHNEAFDQRILRIAMKRYGDGLDGWETYSQERKDEIADAFKARPSYCTCNSAKPILKLPPTPKMIATGKKHWFKTPNLDEAHQHFTGRPHVDAHRAMPDVDACLRVYFGLNPPARPLYAGLFELDKPRGEDGVHDQAAQASAGAEVVVDGIQSGADRTTSGAIGQP